MSIPAWIHSGMNMNMHSGRHTHAQHSVKLNYCPDQSMANASYCLFSLPWRMCSMNKTFMNKHTYWFKCYTMNTLQIALAISYPFFAFTHYSTITDISIFLHLSFSISPLCYLRKMNWTITIMHSAWGYELAKCKQEGSADPKCESLSREFGALKCLTAQITVTLGSDAMANGEGGKQRKKWLYELWSLSVGSKKANGNIYHVNVSLPSVVPSQMTTVLLSAFLMSTCW